MNIKLGRPNRTDMAIKLLQAFRKAGVNPLRSLALVALETTFKDVSLFDMAWVVFPERSRVGNSLRCRFKRDFKELLNLIPPP